MAPLDGRLRWLIQSSLGNIREIRRKWPNAQSGEGAQLQTVSTDNQLVTQPQLVSIDKEELLFPPNPRLCIDEWKKMQCRSVRLLVRRQFAPPKCLGPIYLSAYLPHWF